MKDFLNIFVQPDPEHECEVLITVEGYPDRFRMSQNAAARLTDQLEMIWEGQLPKPFKVNLKATHER